MIPDAYTHIAHRAHALAFRHVFAAGACVHCYAHRDSPAAQLSTHCLRAPGAGSRFGHVFDPSSAVCSRCFAGQDSARAEMPCR